MINVFRKLSNYDTADVLMGQMISVIPVIQTGLNDWHSTLPNVLWGFPHGASATARMTHSFNNNNNNNNNAFSVHPCKSAESTFLLLFVFLFAETFGVDSGHKDIIHKKPITLNTLLKVTDRSRFCVSGCCSFTLPAHYFTRDVFH